MVSRVKSSSSIYTKNFSNDKILKSDLTCDCLGSLDELTSFLGVVKASVSNLPESELKNINDLGLDILDFIENVQNKLMNILSLIATNEDDKHFSKLVKIESKDIDNLKEIHFFLLKNVELGRNFILPGKNIISAHIDVSRAVARRAERNLIKFILDNEVKHLNRSQDFLNRLADILFVLGRFFEKKI